jgi:hypothetical protein
MQAYKIQQYFETMGCTDEQHQLMRHKSEKPCNIAACFTLGHWNGRIMRLNGWQRIGLVLSVLWVVGAAIHERNKQVNAAYALFQSQYRMCLERADSMKNCGETVSLQATLDATANWLDVAFYAFSPVIAGWLIALIATKTYRWISDGFSKKHD